MGSKKLLQKPIVSLKKPKSGINIPLKGRDIIVKSLEQEGVEVIFGYPGGASMEIHQALTLTKKSSKFKSISSIPAPSLAAK